jgi:hypothetical protein
MRRFVPVLPFAVLVAFGCGGSSSPSLNGTDTPPPPDSTQGTDDSTADDVPLRDNVADDSPADVTTVDVWLPDAPATDLVPGDVPGELLPDVPVVPLPYPLCQPCRTDLECETADVKAPCLEEGPDGSTCGFPCATDSECPDGFQCVRDDVHGRQCRPLGGAACPCRPGFVTAGFVTTCWRENDLGRCTGERRCDQECPVSAPSTEVCDGIDNNCEGSIDEGLGTITCGLGACLNTVQSCVDGRPVECVPRASKPEACDGIDNNCDGTTDEDLGTLSCGLGICAVTVDACIGGRPQPCWPGPAGAEACNGLDDNCDGQTDEGFGNTACGTGECARTVQNCQGGHLTTCVPGEPTAEVCNRLDDDCNGRTDDATITCGTGACQRTVAACADGVEAACVPGSPSAETCNGQDDNCDGQTDEGFVLGGPCDGADADGCATGTVGCLPNGTAGCIEPGTGLVETCNGRDDDCDGQTDETGCACPIASFGGHLYLFCDPTANWTVARDTCAGWGYHLVTITDAAENKFVIDKANTLARDSWWIGLNDQAKEGTYVWADGTAAGYTVWVTGAPNNGGFGGKEQDCVEMMSTLFSGYGWNDGECSNQRHFVCELQ